MMSDYRALQGHVGNGGYGARGGVSFQGPFESLVRECEELAPLEAIAERSTTRRCAMSNESKTQQRAFARCCIFDVIYYGF